METFFMIVGVALPFAGGAVCQLYPGKISAWAVWLLASLMASFLLVGSAPTLGQGDAYVSRGFCWIAGATFVGLFFSELLFSYKEISSAKILIILAGASLITAALFMATFVLAIIVIVVLLSMGGATDTVLVAVISLLL